MTTHLTPEGHDAWVRKVRAELDRAGRAGLAGILVTQDGQLCSGGREPIERGTRAYTDAEGWVWCPEHIPGPEHANG